MKPHRFIQRTRLGRILVWTMILQVCLFQTLPVWALPDGEQVTHGNVTFTRSGNQLIVNQGSNQAIVNYDSFSIGIPETVQFMQPGVGASILNRVTGASSSEIAGALLANGNVYLINPNGILFSSTARIDVGGLVASGLPMADEDFLAGRLFFSGAGGSVVNEGRLEGRYVYLIGTEVENFGSISADDVILAAGQRSVLIDEAAGGEIRLILDGEEEGEVIESADELGDVLQQEEPGLDADPEILDPLDVAESTEEEVESRVANVGEIDTTGGGSVHIQAEVVEQSGTITAEQDVVLEGTLTVEGLTESLAGGITLIGHSPLTIDADVISAMDISFEAVETAMAGDDLTVNAGVTVQSTGGSINLHAGDHVILQAGSLVDANVDLITIAGLTDLDGLGGQTIEGTMTAVNAIDLTAIEDIDILAPQNSRGASFSAQGANFSNTGGAIETEGGDLALNFSGNITVDDALNAGAGIATLTSTGGEISGPGTITADQVALRAATGIGSASPLQTAVNTVAAENTTSGGIQIQNDNAGAALSVGAVDGLSGVSNVDAIRITTTGDLVIDDGITAGTDAILTSSAGSISGGGQITASGAALRAATGIGDASPLQTSVDTLAAANSATGAIQIANTSAGATLGVGTVDGLIGVSNAGSGITIESTGLLAITQDIVDTAGGDIILSAQGATASDDLTLAANVSASGGDGSIFLTAGDSIEQASGTVSSAGLGTISYTASTGTVSGEIAMTGGAIQTDAGAITLLADGTISLEDVNSSGGGTISATSLGSVTFNQDVDTAGGDLVADAGNNLSLQGIDTAGGVVDLDAGGTLDVGGDVNSGSGDLTADAGGDATFAGTVTTSNGAVTVTAAAVDFQDALDSGGGAVTVTSTVGAIDFAAVDTAAGDLIAEAATDLRFNGMVDTLGGAITADAGNVMTFAQAVDTGGGDLDADATGPIGFSGTLTTSNGALQVTGAGVTFLDTIDSGGGNVTVTGTVGTILFSNVDTASGDLTADAAGDLQLVGTTVDTLGGAMDFAAGTGVSATADLDSGGGDLAVDAGGNISLAGVTTSNGSVTVVSSGGDVDLAGMVDSGGGDIDVTAAGSTTVGAAMDAGGGAIRLEATAGTLTLNDDVDAGGTDLELFATTGAIDQTGGALTADGLEFTAGAAASLAQSGNTFETVAGTAGGDVALATTTSLVVGVVGGSTGITGGGVDLTSASDLDVEETIAASGKVSLVGTNLTVAAAITTGGGDFAAAADQILITSQGGGNNGSVDTDGGAIDLTSPGTIELRQTSVLSGGPAAGGMINIAAGDGLDVINTGIDSSTGTGGALGIGGGVNIQGSSVVTVGAGDIVLDGGLLDVIIDNSTLNFDANTGLISAKRDVKIINGSSVNSQNGFNIIITADSDSIQNPDALGSAFGGVLVDAGSSVASDGTLTIRGTDGLEAPGTSIDADGSLTAAGDIDIAGTTTASADVNVAGLTSSGGSITVISSGELSANGAIDAATTVFLEGEGDVDLADHVVAGDGITVSSVAGAISQSGGTLTANSGGAQSVLLSAATGIGDGAPIQVLAGTLAANNATSGNLEIAGPGDLAVGSLSSTQGSMPSATGLRNAGGDIVVDADGNLTVGAAIDSQGGEITLTSDADGNAAGDLVVNAGITTGGGTFTARGDTFDNTGGIIDTGTGATGTGGDIDIAFNNAVTVGNDLASGGPGVDGGSISVVSSNLLNAATALTVNGNLSSLGGSGGTLTIGAGTILNGTLSVGAGDVVLDGGGLDLVLNAAQLFDVDTGLTARRDILISQALGTLNGANLTIEADSDGNENTDGLGTAFGGVLVNGAGSINSTGFLVIQGSELLDVGGAPASVNLASAANTVTATGNLLIEGKAAAPANSSVELAGAVVSSGGSISILSAQGIEQDAAVTTSGGTVDVEAQGGDVLMGAAAATTSGGGNIRYEASDDAWLTALDAGPGSVSVHAGQSILDANAGAVNVTAATARFAAGDTLGDAGDSLLETGVQTVAARAGGGGIGLSDQDAVTVGTVGSVAVNRVADDGATGTIEEGSDLRGLGTLANGHVTQIAAFGDLTIDDAVSADGSGNVLISALSGGIALNDTVTSTTGSINLGAGSGAIQLAATGGIQTDGAGTINTESTGPTLMADGAEITTGGGDVVMTSSNGDMIVGRIDAGSGRVGLASAAGSILDGGDTGGADVTGAEIRLIGANGVGNSGDRLDIAAAVVEAESTLGSLFIESSGPVRVDTLASDPQADIVSIDGSLSGLAGLAGSGNLQTGNNGDIVLLADDTITVGSGVSADGTGNVLLQTTSGGDVVVNSLVRSDLGNLSVLSAGGVDLFVAGDNLATAGGSIDIESAEALFMASGGTVSSGGGSILISGGDDVFLGGLNAGAGQVQVRAAGNIVDGDDINPEVTASTASFVAGNAAGGEGPNGTLELVVGRVAAVAGLGGIFLHNAGPVSIDSAASFSVDRVQTDGTTMAQASQSVDGHSTTSGGAIVQQVQGGDLTVSAAVDADGAGNVLLETLGAGDVRVNTTVNSGSGNISVLAANGVNQAAAGDITTSGGTLDVAAANGAIAMANGAVGATSGGNVQYRASGDVIVGSLDAGSGTVFAESTAGSIRDGGNTHADIIAGGAGLMAAVEVGAVAAPDALETSVDTIAASAQNGIALEDVDAVTVGSVAAATIGRVQADGTTVATPTTLVAGHTTLGAAAPIVQTTLDGDLTIESAVSAAGAGNVLLQTRNGGDLIANAGVQSAGGSLTLLAADGVQQGNGGILATTAGGTIDVEAQNGNLTMVGAASSTTSGENIRYAAAGEVALTSLDAGAGQVSVVGGGNILSANTTPVVVASRTRLEAGGTIGGSAATLNTQVSTLAARAGTGIYLGNTGAVTVDDVGPIAVNRVGLDGSLASAPTDGALSDLVTTSAGNIILVADNAITINDGTAVADELGVNAGGTGNVLLQTLGTGDVRLNAGVQSGSGSISLLGADQIVLATAAADVTTGGGSIDLEAGSGSIRILDPGATLSSGGGNINLAANADLILTGIDAGAGTVTAASATGSILDGGDLVADITASATGLTAANAVGNLAVSDSIDTDVDTVAATAGAGGISLADRDGVTIGEVTGGGVNRVQVDGTTVPLAGTAGATGLATASGGNIVAMSSGGNLVVDEAVAADGAGNVLLRSLVSGDVVLNAAAGSGSGAISVLAAAGVQQAADGDMTTAGGTLDVEAVDTIVMSDDAVSSSSGGNIRYAAGHDITLGSLDAGAGTVYVESTAGAILDGGVSHVDILAAEAGLVGNQVGDVASGDTLETSVDVVAAFAEGGIALEDTDAVTVANVAAVQVDRVQTDGSTAAVATTQVGLHEVFGPTGSMVMRTLDGTLNLDIAARTQGGNILLQTQNGGDIVANAVVQSATGNLSLDAADDIVLAVAGDLATGSAGTIDVVAAGNVSIADGTRVTTGTGNIRIEAATGNVTLGGLATAGDVAVIAGGSILDGGDLSIDLAAANALLSAGGAIGSPANQIDTTLATLAGQASDGIFTDELAAGGNLEIGSVAFAGVDRVGTDGTTSGEGAQAEAGLSTSGNGPIVATVQNGTLTVSDNVSAGPSGNILLQTVSAGDIALNASVDSSAGAISIASAGGVQQSDAGDIGTGGGSIDVRAGTGSITMADGAESSTDGGDIHYGATSGDITVGRLDAGTGNVWINAPVGSILDAGDADGADVTGDGATLVAGQSLGSPNNALDTDLATVEAEADAGGIFLHDAGWIDFGPLSAQPTATTVLDDGTLGGSINAPVIGEVRTLSGGDIVLLSDEGQTTVSGGIHADGAGNILLQIPGGIVFVESPVQSGSGHISILSGDVNLMAPGISLSTGGGTIDLEGENGVGIGVFGGGGISSGGGDILVSAGVWAFLQGVDAGSGQVQIRAGDSIDREDFNAPGPTITASTASLVAGDHAGMGSPGHQLDLVVDTVAAQVGSGGMFLHNTGAVTIDSVASFDVNRVQSDGTTLAQASQAVAGHTSAQAGAIVQQVEGGDLTVATPVSAGGTGNVLLETLGTGDVLVNAAVDSGSGNISIRAADSLSQAAAGDVSTGGSGTVLADAGNLITMADASSSTTTGGDIQYQAGADITLASLNAASGSILVDAGASIVDGGELATDAIGSAVALIAGAGIGQPADALDTETGTLAAQAADDIFVANRGEIAVDDVQVTVSQVDTDGDANAISSGPFNDLTGSTIVLVSDDTITVNDGSDGDGTGVEAAGAGNVLLQTTSGDIDLASMVRSGTGNISVVAAGHVSQSAAGDITTGGAGTLDVEAGTGAINMSDGATATTTGGTIRYAAGTDVGLTALDAGTGGISVIAAAGAITDADQDPDVDLVGSTVRLEAATRIGGANDVIATAVDTVAANAGSGEIFIQDQDDLALGNSGFLVVNRVGSDGAATPFADAPFGGANAAGELNVTTVDGDLTVDAASSGSKVFLEAMGTSRDVVVNDAVSATDGNVIIKAPRDVVLNADVTASRDVGLWADVDGDFVGRVEQTAGVAEARDGDLFAAGVDIVQTGASILRADNGTVVLSATNDINLGSTLNGIEAHDIVAGGANIIVDTVVTGQHTVVLNATDGSIFHTTSGAGQARATTLGLIATEDVGVSAANPFQVATEFLGTFAEGDEFVVEEDDTSAGLLITTGFYPNQGPEGAIDIPRPFETEEDIIDLLEEKIQAEDILNIVVPGDLTGDLLLAGQDAILDIGGSINLQEISVGDNLTADIGLDLIVGVLTAGSLNLNVGRNGEIGQLSVDTYADARFGGYLSGNTMGIGGPLNLNVGRDLDYGTITLGAPLDNITVGGNARVNSLNEQGSLNLDVRGGYNGGSLSVGNTLNATVGQNMDLGNLDAGTLVLNVGGDGTINSFGVGGNATASVGGNLAGSSMNIGGATDLDVGGNWEYTSVSFGGDADVMVGGDATIDDLAANQNLIAMVGNGFLGTTLAVNNDATIDVAGDWVVDSVAVGGLLDATVGGQTRITDLNAGTLDLDTGSGLIDTLLTGNDATILSAGDFESMLTDIGNDADVTVGGNLDVVEFNVGGSLLADVDNAFTFDRLDAGQVTVTSGTINMGQLSTGTASLSAGGSINNNGSSVNASSLSMTAGGNIGAGGSPIQLNVGTIQTVSGGGDVYVVQNKAGDTPTGLLRAGGYLNVSVPQGGLIDNNGLDLNIVSGADSRFNAQYLGTVDDALEVDIALNMFLDGAGLSGADPGNQTRIFANLDGTINGEGRRITYVGSVPIPGLVLLNGQLLLGNQFLLAEVFRTEAFVVETPEIRSPEGVFGDPYFIHLYMQISEAWNLFLDFILFGEAEVNADPEMPPDAKRTIKIGGTEKPYAR